MEMETAASRWPDLPPDLLRDISARLHDALDFVRFHAVCQSWRDTAPVSRPSSFLPWLLAPGGGQLFQSIFSKTAWGAHGVFSSHKWLACADGAGTWLLTAGGEAPCLVNPLTGVVTSHLPGFPDGEIAASIRCASDGVVFADGTIALCGVAEFVKNVPILVAAFLRPGDAAWAAVEEPLVANANSGFCSAPAHINGEIVLADFHYLCAVKLLAAGGEVDVLETRCELDDPAGNSGWTPYSYTFESRGELLAVHVHVNGGDVDEFWRRGLAGTMSVSLYALELGADGGERPRWVRRDGGSLADCVLFLGRPASVAVDAARFGGAVAGGSAYFVLNSSAAVWTMVPKMCRVYRYSFLDGSATVVEDLPDGWEKETSIMWFVPQPATIATTHEIRERLQIPNNNSAARSIILRIEKTPPQLGPYFRVFVGNLPWKVDSSRLRQFFSKHGQVVDARVICDGETGHSRGFGFITMATVESPAAAVAALDGKILDDRAIRVNFAEKRRTRGLYVPLW